MDSIKQESAIAMAKVHATDIQSRMRASARTRGVASGKRHGMSQRTSLLMKNIRKP